MSQTLDGQATESLTPGTAMLGRVVLLVRDYDEALAFYTYALSARTLHDETLKDRRYLHIALPDQTSEGRAHVGIWLLKAGGEDVSLVGRQAGGQPFLVLYTNDCEAAVARFKGAGGGVRGSIRKEGDASFAHCIDLYGNEILFVERG